MDIFTDGCCNKTIGSCVSVVDSDNVCLITKYHKYLDLYDFLSWFEEGEHNGRTIFKVAFTDVSTQQNNGAELVAAIIGICIAYHHNYKRVYCDSTLIVEHWSKKVSKTIKDERKAKLQRFLIKVCKLFENAGGKLIWISGDDNKADLGFHKKK